MYHNLSQCHCGHNWEGILFLWLHIICYSNFAFVGFELSVCRGSLMNTYMEGKMMADLYFSSFKSTSFFKIGENLSSFNLSENNPSSSQFLTMIVKFFILTVCILWNKILNLFKGTLNLFKVIIKILHLMSIVIISVLSLITWSRGRK